MFSLPRMSMADRIIEAREARKLTPSELAKLMGVSRQAVGQWESGETRPKGKNLEDLANKLGVRHEWLSTGRGPRDVEENSETSIVKRQDMIDVNQRIEFPAKNRHATIGLIDILRATSEGPKGEFTMSGVVVGQLQEPRGLANSSGIFAVYVVGNTMEPRYFAGEAIILSPFRPAAVGDFVVVELKPLKESEPAVCFLKRLVRQTPKEMVLAQYNPAGEVSIPLDKIKHVYRLMSTAEQHGG